MSFVYSYYLPIVLFFFAGFLYFGLRNEKRFYTWIADYWFYRKKNKVRLASLLKYTAFLLLLLAMLDLRGKPERVKTSVSDQRTIILIDASASMLAEDVRPNRFKKAIIIARHFIKNAFGHQVSVLVFSDTHKRLIPFTDDIDLLDARVAGLEDMDLKEGGSNLSQAIYESFSYFSAASGSAKEIQGNLLVLTDSEENGEQVKIDKNLENFNLAIVGIGTRKGATIPMRLRNGRYQGNKRFEGREVITKLDEENLKSFSKVFPNYKYWIALSYSMPTQEILDFFRLKIESTAKERDHISRPVKMHLLVIPALILLILSYFFRFGRVFKSGVLFLALSFALNGQEEKKDENPRDKFWEENAVQLDKLRDGDLEKDKTFKLAEKAMKNQLYDDASLLYKGTEISKDDIESKLNYGTSLLAQGKLKEGLKLYDSVKNLSRDISKTDKEKISKLIRKNSLLAIKEEEKKQKEKEKKKKEGEKGEGENNPDSENQEKNEKKENQKSENKDQEGKGEDKDKEKDKQKQNESQKEREERIRKQKKMVKVPSLLKQLLSEDRDLQKKNIDPRTHASKRDRFGKNKDKTPYSKKDW